MLRRQLLGGSFYFDSFASGGLNHQANVRHGSLFVYKTDIFGNTKHTLPPTDFLPHRAGMMWIIVNLGPGSMFLVARGSVQPRFDIPCQMMAVIFMLHQDGRDDGLTGEQDASWRVKLLPLRGQTLFTCLGDTISTPSTTSTTNGDPTPTTTTTTTSTPETISCEETVDTLCENFWTPSSDGDDIGADVV